MSVLYEGVLHKQQNEFDTWLNMQLVRLSPEPSEHAEAEVGLLLLFRLCRRKRWLDLDFLNIHFPRPDSQFVKPCRAFSGSSLGRYSAISRTIWRNSRVSFSMEAFSSLLKSGLVPVVLTTSCEKSFAMPVFCFCFGGSLNELMSMGMASTSLRHLTSSRSKSWLSMYRHISCWLSTIVPSARALLILGIKVRCVSLQSSTHLRRTARIFSRNSGESLEVPTWIRTSRNVAVCTLISLTTLICSL